jgi:hypothetical protein
MDHSGTPGKIETETGSGEELIFDVSSMFWKHYTHITQLGSVAYYN